MNKLVKTLAASLLAVAAVASADALTYVKLTGSTAFRKSTVAAIINSLNSPTGAYIGSSVSGANQAVIHGTLKNGPSQGEEVVFQLAWAGSVGGVQVLDQNLTTIPGASFSSTSTWISTSGNTLSGVSVSSSGDSYSISGGTALSGTISYDAAATADVALSDTNQSVTPYNTTALWDIDGSGYGYVGIVPFTWIKGAKGASVSQGSYDRLTNITAQAAKRLITDGVANLTLFTGNDADAGVDVVLTGRNNDSGTRLIAFLESGFGLTADPKQYSLTVSGGTITGLTEFSAAGGYASGGSLATALSAAPATNSPKGRPFIVVSYVGISDALNVNGGANALTYNGVGVNSVAGGVSTSGLAAKIQQGAYSFWGYEHLLYRESLGTSSNSTDIVKRNAADLVAQQIGSVDAAAAGLLNDVGVSLFAARSDENSAPYSLR